MMSLYSCMKLIQHITQSMWWVKVWAMFVKRGGTEVTSYDEGAIQGPLYTVEKALYMI